MNSKEGERKVKEILADRLDIEIENITLNSDLANDLGLDSFLAVELGFELKEHCGVVISNQELVKIKTVEDIVKLVTSKQECK